MKHRDFSAQSGLCSAAGMEVDVLEFRVPAENNKFVIVWDIQPVLTEAQIYVSPSGPGLLVILWVSSAPSASFTGPVVQWMSDYRSKHSRFNSWLAGSFLIQNAASRVLTS